jgi:hypothetical protein
LEKIFSILNSLLTFVIAPQKEFVRCNQQKGLLFTYLTLKMPPTKLIGEERTAALKEISEWSEVHGRDAIQRKFLFQDFKQAWSWMNKVADIADKVFGCCVLAHQS